MPTAFLSSMYDLPVLYRVVLGSIMITLECIITHHLYDTSLCEANNAPTTSSK